MILFQQSQIRTTQQPLNLTPNFRNLEVRGVWDKPSLFEDIGFILYCFGMDCIYFQNGLFLFFLASFIVSFSNYEANFFPTMLYVIVFKLMCYYVNNRIY